MFTATRHIAALMLVAALTATGVAVGAERPDTLQIERRTEMDGLMQRRMLQSAYPVEITRKGNAVCVRSQHDQLLPVYNKSGVFYAAFRISKGTNWLSGLPRGTYIINNQRVTIS